jgi:hypothetical protein
LLLPELVEGRFIEQLGFSQKVFPTSVWCIAIHPTGFLYEIIGIGVGWVEPGDNQTVNL